MLHTTVGKEMLYVIIMRATLHILLMNHSFNFFEMEADSAYQRHTLTGVMVQVTDLVFSSVRLGICCWPRFNC